MKGIKVGDKISKYPIIQGGMGVGISMHKLAGNVSKEGGIGIISTADIGYQEEDFYKNPMKANLRAIGKEIKKAREIAGEDKILGVNVMVALKNYADIVKECVRNKIDLIISGAGIPKELPDYVKGTKTKIAPIVSSLRCCKLIVKHWMNKYDYVPDMIVIEGPEAGGHLGFKQDELLGENKPKLEDITVDVVNYIKEIEKETVNLMKLLYIALPGIPTGLFIIFISSFLALIYAFLNSIDASHSSVATNLVAICTPLAPKPKNFFISFPSQIPPAAITGISFPVSFSTSFI